MAEVSVRELRSHADEFVDRAARGERITITHAGKAVAELSGPSRAPLSAETLLMHWRLLPQVDPVTLRDDVDDLLDAH
jgi:antitoxin (DNA-binding transcriptional repressor) of toxin-antitoxin stability system